MEVKLEGWTTYKDGLPDAGAGLNGEQRSKFFYLADNAVKDDIAKNMWRFSGDYHQNGKCGVPVLNVDGKLGAYILSWRSWGSLMAEAWNDIEQAEKYDYMDFYMTPSFDESVHAAEETVIEA